MKRIQLLIPILGVAVFIAFSAFYIVDEREKALRLWFGEVTAEIEEPGLYFKIPLFHEIVKYDDRILALDTQPLEVTPADDRRWLWMPSHGGGFRMPNSSVVRLVRLV